MTMLEVLSSGEGICPVCETEREIQTVSKREIFTIKNEPIELIVEVEYCSVCSEYFADVETEEKNFQAAYRVYREKHGLLQPEEIKAIREKYCLGQRAFSLLLGWGEITIHRYEAGALQDEIHNNELVFMKDPDNLAYLFEKNKDRLSSRVSIRVMKRLEYLLQNKKKSIINKLLESFFGKASNDIDSGFRLFDLERFENTILYFASNKGVLKTKLLKLLWYFDFTVFKNYHKSATGAKYVHLPLGPVPDNYETYLIYLVKDNILGIEEVPFDGGYTGELCHALVDADLTVFTDYEVAYLKKVDEYFNKFTARKISDYSHKEAGYVNTSQGQTISYSWADELSVDIDPVVVSETLEE